LRAESATAVATARVTPEIMNGTVFVPHFMREVERQLLGLGRSGDKLVPARVEKEVV
jgi:hypothetical protein